jgi:pimeloyl-ACP methyl ester carboxylesterase
VNIAESFLTDQRPVSVPIWTESFFGADWAILRVSPVYLGLGVPRGDGSAVIPIPGFLGSDIYLTEMRLWLRRVGYKPYKSRIGRNADCLDVIADRLFDTIERAMNDTGRPVHLVGHSLGGIIARAVTTVQPEWIASVTTLGSPFRGIRSHPYVLGLGEMVRDRIQKRQHKDRRPPNCYTGYCKCGLVAAMQEPYPDCVPLLAIYTKADGVVDWRYCMSAFHDKNCEVAGTHTGLAFNAAVYRHLARFLANIEPRD